MSRILVAGIGNIFLGDDAFGCEAARALAARPLPPGVIVRDFGIRCLDLAYSLAGGWSAVIVLDAVSRSSVPGTLFRITLEDEPEPAATLNAHNVGVEHVRALAARMAIALPPMFLIGCEPAALEPVAGDRPSLSPPVAAALPHALAMAEALARECFASHNLEVVHS